MRLSIVSFLAIASWVTLFVPAGAAAPAPAAPAAAGAAAGELYTPAKDCGVCHDAMYKAWSTSVHARSATSPAFLEAARRASGQAQDKRAVEPACLWCHAPTTLLSGDTALRQPISNEGITCDFCHTVAAVDMEGTPRFDQKPGPVKRGPLAYTRVEGHEAAYSALHRSSPFLCASCHEFVNAQGVAILSNYSEWKESPYPARGVSCQDCHMALVPGSPARSGGPEGSRRLVNLHHLVGGSAMSQVARGLDLTIDSVSASGSSAQVSVSVTNVAAGHSVPGGLATKTLILAVGSVAADGSLEHRQERQYRRELRDAAGTVLESVADMFQRAASVGRDTRLKPLESRRETFTVPLSSVSGFVVARLEYRDASDPRGEPVTSLIVEVRRPFGQNR